MKRAFHVAAVLALACMAFSVCPTNGQDKASMWMKQKRDLTLNILAGLTEGDFEKVNANATAMNFLGHLEKWARAGQPEYKQQTTYFAFANRELIRHAKEKNIDGATLAFGQLTTSCVQCHKIVRDTKK